jgi:Calx-beta domain
MTISGVSHRSWSALLLVAAFVASMLVTAAPASGVTPPDPVVVPPSPSSNCVPPSPWAVDGPCLEVPIGGRVLNDVTARLIFWLPPGYSFAPGVPGGDALHMEGVEQFFDDLSGSETYNILTQYHDSFPEFPSLASDPTRGYHPNRIRTETYVETRPFPAAPLSATDIDNEVLIAGAAAGWPVRERAERFDNVYIVFTPVGVQTCTGVLNKCSGVNWAGLHRYFSTPVEGSTATCPSVVSSECTEVANIIIPTLGAALLGVSPPYPHNEYLDPVLDVTWHEVAEAVSDPVFTGWENASNAPPSSFFEMADLCNPQFMPDGYGPRAADGSNVTLNGRPYLLQRVYSNAVEGCTLGFHGQFVNFRPLEAKTTASPPFALTADATSTLPVSYAAAGPCTVSGSVVTVTGVGSCTITASQAGDRPEGGFYHPATPVTQTFAITQAPPAVVPGVGFVTEGDSGTTTMHVPVTLSAPSTQTVTVEWATVDSLAQPAVGVDYESASGTVTFAPGETSGTASFTVYGDTLDENQLYNAEWAALSFHAPTNATIGSGLGAVGLALIVDDDPPPTIVAGGVAGLEGDVGDTTLLVNVALSAPSGQTVSVNWSTLDAAAQPQAGVDFAPGSGTLTFAPGETSKTVPFVVHGDTIREPGQLWNAEWGGIQLSAPTNAVFGTGLFARIGLALIVDDD